MELLALNSNKILKITTAVLFIGVCVFLILNGEAQAQIKNPLGNTTTFNQLIANIMRIVAIIAGVIITPIIVYGGIIWMTSGGDPEKRRKAQNIIVYAVVGFGIVLIAEAFGAIVRVVLG